MDSDQMSKILVKIGLVHVVGKFQKETISPEIVHMLSEYEMKILGLHKSDMMKLRNACNSILFGPGQLLRSNYGCGPPHFDIPKSILSNFICDGFKISYIAKLLGVSERTIYRRMQQFNLYVENFSDISDDVLFPEVGKTVKEFPFCGENMVMQLLKQRGFRVQRWRLRDALYTLDETGIQERKKGRLQRRVYNVKGPNHLWHIDTNHKLIRGHFVIVGGIDGYSRLVTFFTV
jgi:hypothetical protein